MTETRSAILLVARDETCLAYVKAFLKSFDWDIRQTSDPDVIAGITGAPAPAAIVLDAREGDCAAVIARIRQFPVPINGTPIVILGGDPALRVGAGGRLDMPPTQDAFTDLLRQWAGPLGDHTLRRAPWNFRYRLIRLLGLDAADSTLGRFGAALRQAIDDAAGGRDAVPAHRLAGIAGMCGFTDLSRLWARVDRGEDDAFALAIATSRSVIAEIEKAQSTGPG
jgi:hypothetical protein